MQLLQPFFHSLPEETKRLSATDNKKTKRQTLMQRHGTALIYSNVRAASSEQHFIDAVSE